MIDIERMDAKNLSLMCEQRWQEGETLDFKRTLPGRDDKARRELLKDVCAFANAGGGVLAFGVVDEQGAAKELAPVADEGADDAILRLGQIIDSGVEPRLRGTRFKPIDVPGGYVLLLRVPSSFDGPHRYVVNEASRFVMRSGRHTVDLTYQQLRAAFGNTAALLEKARAFRTKRLGQIPSLGLPLRMRDGPLSVLHMIPMESHATIDVRPLYYEYSPAMTFEDWHGGSRTLNLDGVLAHTSGENQTGAYTLLFRSGAVETTRFSGMTISDEKRIPSLTIAKFIREAIPKLAAVCKQVGMNGPALFGLAMLRVNGWQFAIGSHEVQNPPDRSNLILPETWIEDIEDIGDVDSIARPLLDLIWQAYGDPFCRYYKDNKWTGGE